MKTRNTLILFGIVVALVLYVQFVERHRKSTREAGEAAGRVVQLDRDKINAVTIQNPDGTIELRKGSNNAWFIEAPVKDRADSTAVSQLFTTLETLRHDAKIEPENKDQLKDYGVTEPTTKVRLARDGEKPVELQLGKDAAVEGKVYIREEGSDTVYVIGSDLKKQLNKKADDFRDRKLADLTTQQVNRVAIATKEGEIELEKKNNHWSITKPLKARADDQKVNDLIASTTTARIDQFLADSSNLGNYGLTEPRGTVSFFTEGSDKPVVLQIGSASKEEKDKEKTFAKLSTRDSVVLVPKDIEKILNNRPNDLRDRNLIRVESDIVDRLTIEAPNKPKIVLARKGESWVRKDGERDVAVNDAIPARLLADLQNTQVTNFVADTATDLPKYGLDQPPVKVTLSSYASENTAETKAGEKPIVTILFGTIEGDSGYAKIDDEPFIVAAPRTLIESIPTDTVQLQDLAIYKYKPEEITTLEIAKEGQAPLSLEKDKDGKWKLAKGDGNVNQTNVQSVVTTLSNLRAIRWAGRSAPEHGLDKPAAVVIFTATQGDKKTPGKLTIGSTTPDELVHAAAEGLEGTFMISKADRDVFNLALTDKPAQQTPSTSAPAPAAQAPAAPAETVTPPVQAPAATPPAPPQAAPPQAAPPQAAPPQAAPPQAAPPQAAPPQAAPPQAAPPQAAPPQAAPPQAAPPQAAPAPAAQAAPATPEAAPAATPAPVPQAAPIPAAPQEPVPAAPAPVPAPGSTPASSEPAAAPATPEPAPAAPAAQ